jgi:23S rRNA (uracil1939-C5)-methyltransferase
VSRPKPRSGRRPATRPRRGAPHGGHRGDRPRAPRGPEAGPDATSDRAGPAAIPINAARPDTRAPVACPHFGPCGGCSLLDRPYDAEAADKSRRFAALVAAEPALARAERLPLLAASEPLFYRTALKVPFARTRHGPVCGFFQRGTHRIVDLHACAIQHPLLTELLVAARELATRLRTPLYDEVRHRGLLRHLLARVAPGTGRALAGLVVTEAGHPATRALARELLARFERRGLVGVVENVNARRTSVIAGPLTRPLVGTPFLVEEADGLRLRAGITSFVQANARQASVLYAEVLRLLGGPRPEAPGDLSGWHVADLFAGGGAIALRLARAGARVTAIEQHAAAVRDGVAAARENGLAGRVRFVAADAAEGLRDLDAQGLDALVVDPPRRGLLPELVELLRGLRLPRLAYVSCNPDSLVRDLAALAPAFEVRALRPVDLFPRTEHLEAVALLERR